MLEDEFSDLQARVEKKSDPVKLAEQFLSGDNIYGKSFITKKQARLFMLLDIMHQDYPWGGYDRLAKSWMHLLTSVDGRGRLGVLDMLKGVANLTREDDVPPGVPLR